MEQGPVSITSGVLTLQRALQLGAGLQEAAVALHLPLGLLMRLAVLLQRGRAHSPPRRRVHYRIKADGDSIKNTEKEKLKKLKSCSPDVTSSLGVVAEFLQSQIQDSGTRPPAPPLPPLQVPVYPDGTVGSS